MLQDSVNSEVRMYTAQSIISLTQIHVQGNNPGLMKLQRPRSGKPFVISTKSQHDLVVSYQQNATGFKAAAIIFGGIGLVIFGTKIAQYGVFKWKERGIR